MGPLALVRFRELYGCQGLYEKTATVNILAES